jgi:hypothetical protein
MSFALKAAVMLGLVAVPMVSMAANYSGECTGTACQPFTTSNSYVLNVAVTVAQQHNALVGDTIEVYNYPPPGKLCEEKDIVWKVNRSPVLNSTYLTYQQTYCMVSDPTK